jgi:hypothetical protein
MTSSRTFWRRSKWSEVLETSVKVEAARTKRSELIRKSGRRFSEDHAPPKIRSAITIQKAVAL